MHPEAVDDLTKSEVSPTVKILIVDDNRDNLSVMERVLEDEAFSVITARSGSEALKLILREDFALIFMDVRMPIMDGFETARIIRERDKSAHIPIMFLTAYARDDARQLFQGYSLGAVDYLLKPVAPEILRAKAIAFADLYRKNQTLRTQKQRLSLSHDKLVKRVKQGAADLATATDELGLANAELNVLVSALETQREVMRNIIANVPGMVWEAWGAPDAPLQHMDFVSDFVEKLLGYSVEECLKTPNFWLQTIHPEDRERASETATRAYKERKSGIMQFRRVAKDGRAIWVESRFAIILDEQGEPVGMRGVTMDITERKIAEKQVQDALKEKDLLLKEIHHRVKNNLQIVSSILSLQSSYIREPQLLEIFHESQARIKSIALIHELLYEKGHLARIEFKDYLENLVQNIFRTIGADPQRIKYTIDADSALMELDSAIHCGLIVNELLTNSIKYAFPDGRVGKIAVKLKLENDSCVLSVEDNGIGLPADLDSKKAKSMGLQLVETLTKQMKATLEMRSEGGASFVLRFAFPQPGTSTT